MKRPTALMVLTGEGWFYVFGKSRLSRKVITTRNRAKALPGRAQHYFEVAYSNHTFKVEA